MNEKPYGPSVKVVCKPSIAPSCDLVVMVKDLATPGNWREVRRFNDMSDDFAYINAHNTAVAVRAKLKEGENP